MNDKLILLCKVVRSSRDIYEVKPISLDVYKQEYRYFNKTGVKLQADIDSLPTRKMKICGKMKFHKIRVGDGDMVFVEWGEWNDGRIVRKVNPRDLETYNDKSV